MGMRLTVDGKPKKLRFSGSVGSLLERLKLNRETVVVKINGRIVPEGESIAQRDSVEVMRVIFGG